MSAAVAFVPKAGRVELVEPEPKRVLAPDEVLVAADLVGFCGTDREIVQGGIAVHPADDHLILGHELLGVVVDANGHSALAEGDAVVAQVRDSCNSCEPCRAGRADFCLSGNYTEFGITRRHGFAQPAVPIPASMLIRVPSGLGRLAVLAEPMSIVEKTLEEAKYQLDRIPGGQRREVWGQGKRAIVTGAGAIGALAVHQLCELGFSVDVVDIKDATRLGPTLCAAAAARYIQLDGSEPAEISVARLEPADFVIEASGDPRMALVMPQALSPGGVLVWVGVAAEEHAVKVDASSTVLKAVLGHNVWMGTVNSSRSHFERALADLQVLATRNRFAEIVAEPLEVEAFSEAIWPTEDVIKRTISFGNREVRTWRR